MNDLKSTVRKFGYYSNSQLHQTKTDLKLEMSDEQLMKCAAYYRNKEKRDPMISELRLLDTLAAKQAKSPAMLALTKLLSNDRYVAETYADVMEKRRALSPSVATPCTLTELLHVANDYLARAGKPSTLAKRSLMLEDCRYTKRIPGASSGFGISGSRHQIRVLTKQGLTGQPETGDALILFLPRKDKSILDYQKKIGKFLNSHGQSSPWKLLANIRTGGLLPSLLLQSNTGLWIDLSRIADEELASPLAPLTDRFVGCHFAIVSAGDSKQIIEEAEEHGIQAVVPATVMHANRMTFTVKNNVLFSLDIDMMRSLLITGTATAALPDEGESDLERIRHTPTSSASCAYLQKYKVQAPTDCVEVEQTLAASAFCKPTAGFYKHALYTALCPIVSLAASGLAYTEQRLAVGLTVPTGHASDADKSIGATVSAALGLYRVQAELGIPSAAISILTDTEFDAPRLTVFSAADGKAISGTHVQAGNSVYCLAPAIDENGIPNFNSLRALLQELTVRSRNDSIVSARVLCNETVTEGLQKMTHGGLYCHMNAKLATDGALPLAVIVESKVPMAGFLPIGTVKQKAATASTPVKLPSLLCPTDSLIWSEKPEFVLLCQKDDINAQVLEDVIVQKGGRATLFDGERSDAGHLARAILGAQVFILCGDAHFPTTRYTQFALDTMLRAGGACWIVGRTDFTPLAETATVFKKNIPEQVLDTVLKKEMVL